VNQLPEEIKMSNPAPGFAKRPDYRVDLVPEARRIRVVLGGVAIADSGAALRIEETGHDPSIYVPKKEGRLVLRRRTENPPHCP